MKPQLANYAVLDPDILPVDQADYLRDGGHLIVETQGRQASVAKIYRGSCPTEDERVWEVDNGD